MTVYANNFLIETSLGCGTLAAMPSERSDPRDNCQMARSFRAALDGDARAYRAFLLEAVPLVHSVVRGRANYLSSADREDIVQDVILAIHEKKHTWRRDHPLKPWIYAIARHKVVDWFRRHNIRQTEPLPEDFEDERDAAQTNVDTRYDVERAVANLQGREQQVVRAIALDGLEINEAAKKLGMSANAVRVGYHRGVKKLKKRYTHDE